eukprot:115301-Hanusia_phi.AAC.4
MAQVLLCLSRLGAEAPQLAGTALLGATDVLSNALTGVLVRYEGSRIGLQGGKVWENGIGLGAVDGGVVGKGGGCDVANNRDAQQVQRQLLIIGC